MRIRSSGVAYNIPVKREALDYHLPPERIALEPVQPRDAARLLVVNVSTDSIRHHRVRDLPDILPPGTVLVFNRSRVVKARLEGEKPTGGRVTVILDPSPEDLISGGGTSVAVRTVRALLQRGKIREGQRFFVGDVVLEVAERKGKWLTLLLPAELDLDAFLETHGKMPLPPYIRREPGREDEHWYQPVFAEEPGSIAAPTASLHFTPELLSRLQKKGIVIVFITLHVGPGTFLPILTEEVEAHRMLPEWYEIPEPTQTILREARKARHPIVAVGTTATRALETWAFGEGPVRGSTELFIHPGYRFRVLDGLFTNFHQPRSTPLALVAAFAGLNLVKRAYEEALREGYRFLSYGDASLWLRFGEDG